MRPRLAQLAKGILKNKNSFLRMMSSLPKHLPIPTKTFPAITVGSTVSFGLFQESETPEEQKTPFERSRIIPYEKMSGKTLDEIDDKEMYMVGFARKQIAHFYHSAVVFLDKKGEYLVMGRQSPFFLKDEEEEKLGRSPEPTSYLGIGNLFNSVTETSIDNEKKYDFFHSSPFKAEMSTAMLSGSEIKEIIKKADETICDDHLYNLVISNCYSASVDVLVNAVEIIHKRKSILPPIIEENNKSIMALYQLIQEAREDNFSIGVENNEIVEKALEKVDQIMRTRNLMELYEKNHPKPKAKPMDEEQELYAHSGVGF